MLSLWESTVQLPRFDELKENKTADILIIGGGIAGILTAYFLHQSGADYILVEKDRICGETTGNTTAKITFQHGLIYHRIAESSGIEAAKKYLEANRAAFDKYARLCQSIDCDYEIKDNYVYLLNNKNNELENEINVLRKIGYEAKLSKSLSIPVETAGAVSFSNQAQFNPLKFIKEVAKGLNIYENTFVRRLTNNTAITDKAEIKAKKVVIATHFPFINRYGCYSLKQYQSRSYVLALENAGGLDGMYVDDGGKGLSFRSYKDLLLLGGGGHRTGEEGGGWEELRAFAAKAFPGSAEKFHWSAQDCMSLDEIPYIGRYSVFTPDLYVASGFNKWGMTGAMTAATLLCDLLHKRQNSFAELFNPSRSILHHQLTENCLKSAKNLITLSPKRCTHLGCALKWNDSEYSWDCPCHGSRFTEDGRIINNPANRDLK